ncbi:MAG: ZIP family metal transporter [Ottowia sp.]
MNLIAILLGTLMAGVGSVWLAALLSFGVLARYTEHMLSLAAGALLGAAFVSLVPEAFATGAPPRLLSATLLAGLVFFFLLEKAELWHHGHEHDPGLPTLNQAMAADTSPRWHGTAPLHAHGHGPVRGGWAVLAGDAVHGLGDGILIASAFMADLHVGWAAAFAVLVHEVPHHMGDLAVLHHARGGNRRSALLRVSLAGAVTVVGGVLGYALLSSVASCLPFLLALAASSFIYVALADLVPQLQRRLTGGQTVVQVFWLGVGVLMVFVALMGAQVLGHSH